MKKRLAITIVILLIISLVVVFGKYGSKKESHSKSIYKYEYKYQIIGESYNNSAFSNGLKYSIGDNVDIIVLNRDYKISTID